MIRKNEASHFGPYFLTVYLSFKFISYSAALESRQEHSVFVLSQHEVNSERKNIIVHNLADQRQR